MCVSPARGLTPSLFQSPGEVDVLASPMSKTRRRSQNGRCSDDGANFLLHPCTSLPTSSLFNRHHYRKNRSFMSSLDFVLFLCFPFFLSSVFFSCFIFVKMNKKWEPKCLNKCGFYVTHHRTMLFRTQWCWQLNLMSWQEIIAERESEGDQLREKT